MITIDRTRNYWPNISTDNDSKITALDLHTICTQNSNNYVHLECAQQNLKASASGKATERRKDKRNGDAWISIHFVPTSVNWLHVRLNEALQLYWHWQPTKPSWITTFSTRTLLSIGMFRLLRCVYMHECRVCVCVSVCIFTTIRFIRHLFCIRFGIRPVACICEAKRRFCMSERVSYAVWNQQLRLFLFRVRRLCSVLYTLGPSRKSSQNVSNSISSVHENKAQK